jgi:hypothetical protein
VPEGTALQRERGHRPPGEHDAVRDDRQPDVRDVVVGLARIVDGRAVPLREDHADEQEELQPLPAEQPLGQLGVRGLLLGGQLRVEQRFDDGLGLGGRFGLVRPGRPDVVDRLAFGLVDAVHVMRSLPSTPGRDGLPPSTDRPGPSLCRRCDAPRGRTA